MSRPRTPSITHFVRGVGLCANNRTDRTLQELRGPHLRSFLGLRSSSVEYPKRCCVLRMVDCGLKR
eukprot:7248688-Alexandrium_andersonii.AAC.1